MSGEPDQEEAGLREARRRRQRRMRRRRALAVIAAVVVLAAGVAILAGTRDGGGSQPTAPATVRLTFPEGLRREDMARILEEKTDLSGAEYLAATGPSARGALLARRSTPTSLEGFLFPATYEIGTQTTVPYLVERQIEAFERNMGRVDLRYARSRNLTRYDVVIIASMIEREVVVASERPIVAGVIYNRLKRRMRLDIDATVQYAVGEWRELTAADLASDSPYNTRRYAGLPPGPICNPGLASLQAAAHPKRSAYLYYVARQDGTDRHYFATTPAQFQALQAKARANAAARR